MYIIKLFILAILLYNDILLQSYTDALLSEDYSNIEVLISDKINIIVPLYINMCSKIYYKENSTVKHYVDISSNNNWYCMSDLDNNRFIWVKESADINDIGLYLLAHNNARTEYNVIVYPMIYNIYNNKTNININQITALYCQSGRLGYTTFSFKSNITNKTIIIDKNNNLDIKVSNGIGKSIAHLTISKINKTHEGIYYCNVNYTNGLSYNNSININVHGTIVKYNVGDTLILKCPRNFTTWTSTNINNVGIIHYISGRTFARVLTNTLHNLRYFYCNNYLDDVILVMINESSCIENIITDNSISTTTTTSTMATTISSISNNMRTTRILRRRKNNTRRKLRITTIISSTINQNNCASLLSKLCNLYKLMLIFTIYKYIYDL